MVAPAADAAKRRTLFDISEDLLVIEDLIQQADGDISDPKAESAVTAWLEENAGQESVKIDGYINLIKKWEGEGVASAAESEQYAKRARVRANRVERLKGLLKLHMEKTKRLKIETATGRTVAIQPNGGKFPLQVDRTVDPKMLEPRFQHVPPVQLDTEAVRAALESGEKLEFASLLPRGTSLRIR